MLYLHFQLEAFCGVSVMTPARRQWVVFCKAGAIWFSLRPPSPQIAKPSFFLDAAASARVRLVLMKGAAAMAAACAMNLRRPVIQWDFLSGCCSIFRARQFTPAGVGFSGRRGALEQLPDGLEGYFPGRRQRQKHLSYLRGYLLGRVGFRGLQLRAHGPGGVATGGNEGEDQR